jgi:hypothetical protein
MDSNEKTTCPLIHQCAFYQKSHAYMPPISRRLKAEYCMKSHRQCACWRIFNAIGPEWVPLDMLPYQHERAKEILNEVGEGHEAIVIHENVATGV